MYSSSSVAGMTSPCHRGSLHRTWSTQLQLMETGQYVCIRQVFVLGFLATRAEPALRVMGKTVETLSEGQFSANMLVYTVCVGVGCGMVLGSSKILFGVCMHE